MKRRWAMAVLAAVAIILAAVVMAVWMSAGSAGYKRRLTPELAEGLAARQARDPGSPFLIGCQVIDFFENSRAWLIECHQGKTTRWVVSDETQEVTPEASGSPAEGFR